MLHRVLLLTQPQPDRHAVFFRPPPDFGILFRQALIVSIRHSHMCTRGRGPCPRRGPPPLPRLNRINEASTPFGPHRRACSTGTLRHEGRSARRASDTIATPLFDASSGPHIGAFHVKQLEPSDAPTPGAFNACPFIPFGCLTNAAQIRATLRPIYIRVPIIVHSFTCRSRACTESAEKRLTSSDRRSSQRMHICAVDYHKSGERA